MKKIVFFSHLDLNLYLFRLPVMVELVNKGWDVYAMAPKGDVSNNFKKFGINYINYEIKRLSLNPLNELNTIKEIKKKLEIIKPDILHTFTVKPNIYGTIAGKMARVPIIINSVTGLGSFFVENNLKAQVIRRFILRLYKFSMQYSDGVIFQNQDDMSFFINKKIVKKDKAFLIKGSGIDTNLWKPLNKKRTFYPVRIISIARLIKHKGIEEYLKIAQILKEEYKNKVEFILVGGWYDGNPYSISKKLLIKYIKNKIIIYHDWMPWEKIKNLLDNCDIFVLLSYREGLPRTGVEALSMGLPIITTDVPGCREIVEDGKNGFLVPTRELDKVVEKIRLLINNPMLRKKFGKYSREKAVKEFDIRLIVEKHLDLYLKLIERKIY